jgi:hypothetical protein
MSFRARYLPGLVVLVVVAFAAAAPAQTWTPEQQEIWKFEELQWKLNMEKDATWIDKMVHPNISVWEAGRPMPQNKASLTRWNKYANASSTIVEQEIFPISVTITGNVAVVQYSYLIVREDAKKDRETVSGHWTDILIKEGGRWMFLAWAGGDDPKK